VTQRTYLPFRGAERFLPRKPALLSFRYLLIFLTFIFGTIAIYPRTCHAFFHMSESQVFSRGSYAFKLEIQVNGNGAFKKHTATLTSLKVKIKSDRASSDVLKVKAIRVYMDPKVYQDIETLGYAVTPGNWVTKFYRLPKGKRPSLNERSYIEISFGGFLIRFQPHDRKFMGPIADSRS
jgi:hypothetical protein